MLVWEPKPSRAALQLEILQWLLLRLGAEGGLGAERAGLPPSRTGGPAEYFQ